MMLCYHLLSAEVEVPDCCFLGPVRRLAFWGSTQVMVVAAIVGFGRGWRLATMLHHEAGKAACIVIRLNTRHDFQYIDTRLHEYKASLRL